MNLQVLLAICVDSPAASRPELGRTQYLLGAVVLILNKTFFSDGLVSFRKLVTGWLNGPVKKIYYMLIMASKLLILLL